MFKKTEVAFMGMIRSYLIAVDQAKAKMILPCF